jgi:hypothetical protein
VVGLLLAHGLGGAVDAEGFALRHTAELPLGGPL